MLLTGGLSIDSRAIQKAVELLAIKVPKVYAGGTHISDFEVGESPPEPAQGTGEVPRIYANKRGRRAEQRDEADLLVAYRAGKDILTHLEACGLLEQSGVPC